MAVNENRCLVQSERSGPLSVCLYGSRTEKRTKGKFVGISNSFSKMAKLSKNYFTLQLSRLQSLTNYSVELGISCA